MTTSSSTILPTELTEEAKKASGEKLLRELQNEISKSVKLASEVGVTILKNEDVLSGRGSQARIHKGTMRYRKVIMEYSKVYEAMPNPIKPEVTKKIVQLVRQEGGGFYRHDSTTGLYYEIGDHSAREKTSQALRSVTFQRRKDTRLVKKARSKNDEPSPAAEPKIHNEPTAAATSTESDEADNNTASHASVDVKPRPIKSIDEDAFIVIDGEEEEEDIRSSSSIANAAQRKRKVNIPYQRDDQWKLSYTRTLSSPTPYLSKDIEEFERQHAINQEPPAAAQIAQLLKKARLLRSMATEVEGQALLVHRSDLNEFKREQNMEFTSFLQAHQLPQDAIATTIVPQNSILTPTPPGTLYPSHPFMRSPQLQQDPTMPPNTMQAAAPYTNPMRFAPMAKAHHGAHHHHHVAYHSSSSMSYPGMSGNFNPEANHHIHAGQSLGPHTHQWRNSGR